MKGSRHTGDKALEEGLLAEIGVVLLEVLLRGADKLHGGKLVAGHPSARTVLNYYHYTYPRFSKRERMSPTRPRWTPSGLMAMKVCSVDML